MRTVNLILGTPEWHAHRATHFNASDAPAMMGCSPYKTRSQLLREFATGATIEHDAATLQRFADGHRFEDLARPLAEQILGEELYPCVGVDGKFSAEGSCLPSASDLTTTSSLICVPLRLPIDSAIVSDSSDNDGSRQPAAGRAITALPTPVPPSDLVVTAS